MNESAPAFHPRPPKSGTLQPRHGFGLLTPIRQSWLLRGIAARVAQGREVRDRLVVTHQQQLERLEKELAAAHESTTAACRDERRSILAEWDAADEQTISVYEQEMLQTRKSRHHALAAIRHQRKREVTEEERAFDTEKHLIKTRYARELPKVAALQRTEYGQLAGGMRRIHTAIETARTLTMRRCGGPEQLAALIPSGGAGAAAPGGPYAPSEGTTDEGAELAPGPQGPAVANQPQSLRECIDQIAALSERTEELLVEMRQGWPAKFVESYYLPLLMLGVLFVWCGLIFAVGPQRLALWMLMGIPLAVVIGVAAHWVMALPLRRQTCELHPQLEQAGLDAQAAAAVGRRLSAAKAAARTTELSQQRDAALAELRAQHERRMQEIRDRHIAEQARVTKEFDDALAGVEHTFREGYHNVSRSMSERAATTAATLATRLDGLQADHETQRRVLRESQTAELQHLQQRIESGLARAVERIRQTQQALEAQFPSWRILQQADKPSSETLRWLPLGTIDVHEPLREALGDSPPPGASSLPLTLVRQTHAAVLIECPPEQMQFAAEWVRGTLWRALAAVPGGRLRLTLLDPLGRGQSFASMVSLADYDPQLVTHRVWSAAPQITTRLGELTQHIEDLLQTGLRDRYDTIEAFNAEAGALAEPYRVVAAIGLPAGLTRDGYDYLRALVDGGRRCGVFLILVQDSSQPWPSEIPPLPEGALMRLRIDDRGQLWHSNSELRGLPIAPPESPPAGWLPTLAERIGQQALAAKRVEIPLASLLPPEEYDRGDSTDGLQIPVGRQGVGRLLEIDLGSGMRQHMLVAGKTGSGKSTLLHALITAAAMRYSPDELHLYLLDFKKGVEFKVYADSQLPHARVIGIESQREFGRSVLERLDAELQQRGEQFRAAGVQELSDYRRQTGRGMPRILLVVDEFQEWFVRDDRVAQECTMLLDRLVRQGRSFGIHVVLSSQSLSGAYSLPRATLGQMAIRIALQCSEADAAMILADDNPAARLLSRPGEAIFNDAGGLVEGNQPFQVAWLDPQDHRRLLAELHRRHSDAERTHGTTVVFEGNRPTRWTAELAEQSIVHSDTGGPAIAGLLGEAVRIGPPATLTLSDAPGRNVLCVADAEAVASVLTAWLPTAYAWASHRYAQAPQVLLLDGGRGQTGSHSIGEWLTRAGVDCRLIRPRDAERELVQVAERIRSLQDEIDSRDDADLPGGSAPPPTLVVVHTLERFRELRQDDSFGFSLDDSTAVGGATALQTLLRDGPAVGYHAIVTCGSAETLARWLPRSSHHDIELRIVGRTSAADSAQLIDTPEAADLTPATLLVYDDAGGTIEKFRLCAIPEPEQVKEWLRNRT